MELSALFDGELEGEQRQVVEAHVQGCEACRKRLDGMGRLRRALSALSEPRRKGGRSVLEMLKDKLEDPAPRPRGGKPLDS
jgi:anti-sigma factor RsiW